MLVKEFSRKLNLIKNDLIKNRPNETFLITKEALALIRRRIQNEGKDAAGAQLGDYSTNELPAFFFFGKSANAAGEAKVRKAAKEGEGVSYKELRQFNNRPTDKVDLTFTGAMWREMDVTIIGNTATESTAEITPRTERSKKVAAYNSKRYGDILRLSKDERRMLRLANLARVQKSIRKFL